MTHRVESTPPRRSWTDTALTIGAVAGTVCIVLTTVALVFGLRPVIFETGSMEPAVPTGSLGISRTVPAAEVKPGDIVGVVRDDGARVTHRVVAAGAPVGNSVSLTLRGDANEVSDSSPYVVTEVNRVYRTLPLLGYIASWLSDPYTLALQALAGFGLLAIAFAPEQGWRRSRTGHRLVAGTAVVTVLALGATGVHGAGRADAALQGTATATGTVNTGRPANPTSLRCDNVNGVLGLGDSVTMTWPNPGSHSKYTYHLTVSGGSANPQTSTYTAASGGDPIVVNAGSLGLLGWLGSLLGNLLGGQSMTLQFTLTNHVGNFSSAGSLTQNVVLRGRGLLGLVPSLRCATGGEGGIVTGPAAKPGRATTDKNSPSDESTAPKSSVPPDAPEKDASQDPSAAPPSSEKPAPKPELPPGGTRSTSGEHSFYQDGNTVAIRDADSTEVEFRGSFSPSATVRWVPGTDDLEVTGPDGAVTTIRLVGGEWTEQVTLPPADDEPDPGPVPTPESEAEPAPATEETTADADSPVE
ncbi:peptidase S26 [Gordonia zhaorongruii]|uniref:peptidase S26 n=1 Tax=Gordonia zhaorongruii TaxID=2597659 RepID=UPI0010498B64|nr:peptidase S26 [Gordonia zhaorongruii]